MGQRVMGILYGCEVPAEITDYEQFATFYDNRNTPLAFHTEPDGDKKLMGFFLAVVGDASEHRGAANIDERCVRLDILDRAAEYADALQSWRMLAAGWAEELPDVVLPAPTLWLCPTEVA